MDSLMAPVIFMAVLVAVVGAVYALDKHTGVFDRFDPMGARRIAEWDEESEL